MIYFLFKEHLSVGEDGCYVENVHWRRVHHIGGGSCGRCYFCTDLKTGFLFAVKQARIFMTFLVPFSVFFNKKGMWHVYHVFMSSARSLISGAPVL